MNRFYSILTDHGREFDNNIFSDFCRDKGINRKFTSPRTQEQNGVVERKNRILVEMARTMLTKHDLPWYFWAKIVNTACYIINRAMVRPILNKIPYELYKRKKPNLSHFKAFGCVCYILNNGKSDVGKFDEKSDKIIFLGYASNARSY